MSDAAAKLASRLERLENHLAIVLSVHLFVEHLLDRLIEEKSEIAERILKDHRTYSFSVKLTLVFHLGLLTRELFDNLVALNSLRNTYAHELDVDLAQEFDRPFVGRNGQPLFANVAVTRQALTSAYATTGAGPAEAGVRTLLDISDVTFGWLHDVAKRAGVAT